MRQTRRISVVICIPADIILKVPLLLLGLQPILVDAHIEEVLVGVLASGIPLIDVIFVGQELRLLDVPEDVVWELVEDLIVRCCLELLVVSAAQICNIVVLLTLLEGVEFASKDRIPLLLVEASFLQMIEHGDTGLVFILGLDHV